MILFKYYTKKNQINKDLKLKKTNKDLAIKIIHKLYMMS